MNYVFRQCDSDMNSQLGHSSPLSESRNLLPLNPKKLSEFLVWATKKRRKGRQKVINVNIIQLMSKENNGEIRFVIRNTVEDVCGRMCHALFTQNPNWA